MRETGCGPSFSDDQISATGFTERPKCVQISFGWTEALGGVSVRQGIDHDNALHDLFCLGHNVSGCK
jgi:hypothetical protein